MQRWKITLQYDGTDYHGWQAQNGLRSVQQTVENALQQLCQTDIRVHVAGRTDAGVHALGQVVHADIPRSLSPKRLRLAIQAQLRNEAIAIVECLPVEAQFHARFSAVMRHYRYIIALSPTPPPLLHKRAWWLPHRHDITAMQTAAQYFIGYHDFSSFRAAGCQANSPMRSIDTVAVYAERQWNTPLIICEFSAQSFLYHQIRNMVGTLAQIGQQRRPETEIKRLLECADRTQAAATAPAHGLYFMAVDYR